jgi:uncharacterized protein (TIGR02118 family)
MIMVTVMYPNQEGSRFDMDYYTGTHLPMVAERWGPLGLKGATIVKGLGGPEPGSPATYQVMALVEFESGEAFEKAVATHGEEIFADIPNFTDTQPVVQINDILG